MILIAHRGASHDAPENTLSAARLAWAQQADALECDVHLTRDGRLAVVHDDDLRRVAGQDRRVGDCTLAELRGFDVGSWKRPAFRGEGIPALEEWLALTPASGRVFVELKGGPELVPELQRCLGRAGFDAARLAVISFQRDAVIAAKRALPAAEASWLVEREPATASLTTGDLVRAADEAGLDGLDLDYDWPVGAALIQEAHRSGLKVYAWTVDDPLVAYRLSGDGLDGLTTNRPGWMRAELASFGVRNRGSPSQES